MRPVGFLTRCSLVRGSGRGALSGLRGGRLDFHRVGVDTVGARSGFYPRVPVAKALGIMLYIYHALW